MILFAMDDVRPGMVVGLGLRNGEGQTLLGPGIVLSDRYLARLRQLGFGAIWIDDDATRDVEPEELLSEETGRLVVGALQRLFLLASRETAGLGPESLDGLRRTLDSRKFRQAVQDSGMLERLAGPVDRLIGEVLNRPLPAGLGTPRLQEKTVFEHSLDVALAGALLGRQLDYDRETLRKLVLGCLLHDIGAVIAARDSLDQPGFRSPVAASRHGDHSVLGYHLVRDGLGAGVLCAHIAYQHHERQDGTGAPRGLTGTNRVSPNLGGDSPGQISPLGEIAAIADFYDTRGAARSDGSHPAPDQVWREVAEAAGERLNREMVRRFLAVVPPYPPGTQVVVTAGRWSDHTGVVARVRPEAVERPTIRLLHDPTGARIEPTDIDLRSDDSEIRGVLGRHPVPS